MYMYTYIYMHICIPFRKNEGAIERCEVILNGNLYFDPFELCSRSCVSGVVQFTAVYYSVVQCIVVCCSVLQRVAVCCNV